jgi:hypothetical protein
MVSSGPGRTPSWRGTATVPDWHLIKLCVAFAPAGIAIGIGTALLVDPLERAGSASLTYTPIGREPVIREAEPVVPGPPWVDIETPTQVARRVAHTPTPTPTVAPKVITTPAPTPTPTPTPSPGPPADCVDDENKQRGKGADAGNGKGESEPAERGSETQETDPSEGVGAADPQVTPTPTPEPCIPEE